MVFAIIFGCAITAQAVPVTLKVIDETKGVVSNPKTSDDNIDANIYTWIDDNLKAQNPRTPSDWWYPMYNADGVTPTGAMELTDDAMIWSITLEATPGEYEWSPGAKSLDWSNINPGMVVWEGGNPKFTVAEDGTITGITEVTIKDIPQYNEGTMTLLVTVPAGTDKVYVRGLYGNWNEPLEMTYNEAENAWLFMIDGTRILVGNQQSYKYYYGKDSWDEVEAKEDGSQRGNGEDRTLDYEEDGIQRDNVPLWYGKDPSSEKINKAEYALTVNNSELQIKGNFKMVEIYTVSGEKVETTVVSGSYVKTGLPTGIYLVRIDNAAEKIMIK